MSGPRWLMLDEIRAVHEKQLKRFGGPPGVSDAGALKSALARRVNRFRYGETDIAALAAGYAFGLARNPAFVDGNKRISFLAMMMFLRLNGVPFAPDPAQATAIILSLAAGDTSEEASTRWIKDNWPKA
ncbi:MAG: type II toxin-antitoxin system death-on-curing family toxin [Rhodoblastus sp.]